MGRGPQAWAHAICFLHFRGRCPPRYIHKWGQMDLFHFMHGPKVYGHFKPFWLKAIFGSSNRSSLWYFFVAPAQDETYQTSLVFSLSRLGTKTARRLWHFLVPPVHCDNNHQKRKANFLTISFPQYHNSHDNHHNWQANFATILSLQDPQQ